MGDAICNKAIAWAPAMGHSINLWMYHWILDTPLLRHIFCSPAKAENLFYPIFETELGVGIPQDIVLEAASIRPNNSIGSCDI